MPRGRPQKIINNWLLSKKPGIPFVEKGRYYIVVQTDEDEVTAVESDMYGWQNKASQQLTKYFFPQWYYQYKSSGPLGYNQRVAELPTNEQPDPNSNGTLFVDMMADELISKDMGKHRRPGSKLRILFQSKVAINQLTPESDIIQNNLDSTSMPPLSWALQWYNDEFRDVGAPVQSVTLNFNTLQQDLEAVERAFKLYNTLHRRSNTQIRPGINFTNEYRRLAQAVEAIGETLQINGSSLSKGELPAAILRFDSDYNIVSVSNDRSGAMTVGYFSLLDSGPLNTPQTLVYLSKFKEIARAFEKDGDKKTKSKFQSLGYFIKNIASSDAYITYTLDHSGPTHTTLAQKKILKAIQKGEFGTNVDTSDMSDEELEALVASGQANEISVTIDAFEAERAAAEDPENQEAVLSQELDRIEKKVTTDLAKMSADIRKFAASEPVQIFLMIINRIGLDQLIREGLLCLIFGADFEINDLYSDVRDMMAAAEDLFKKPDKPKVPCFPKIDIEINVSDWMGNIDIEIKKVILDTLFEILIEVLKRLVELVEIQCDADALQGGDYGSLNLASTPPFADGVVDHPELAACFTDFFLPIPSDPSAPGPAGLSTDRSTTMVQDIFGAGSAEAQEVAPPPTVVMRDNMTEEAIEIGMTFLDDVSEILTPVELCRLLSNEATDATLQSILEFSDEHSHAVIERAFDSVTDVATFFACIGPMPGDICENIFDINIAPACQDVCVSEEDLLSLLNQENMQNLLDLLKNGVNYQLPEIDLNCPQAEGYIPNPLAERSIPQMLSGMIEGSAMSFYFAVDAVKQAILEPKPGQESAMSELLAGLNDDEETDDTFGSKGSNSKKSQILDDIVAAMQSIALKFEEIGNTDPSTLALDGTDPPLDPTGTCPISLFEIMPGLAEMGDDVTDAMDAVIEILRNIDLDQIEGAINATKAAQAGGDIKTFFDFPPQFKKEIRQFIPNAINRRQLAQGWAQLLVQDPNIDGGDQIVGYYSTIPGAIQYKFETLASSQTKQWSTILSRTQADIVTQNHSSVAATSDSDVQKTLPGNEYKNKGAHQSYIFQRSHPMGAPFQQEMVEQRKFSTTSHEHPLSLLFLSEPNHQYVMGAAKYTPQIDTSALIDACDVSMFPLMALESGVNEYGWYTPHKGYTEITDLEANPSLGLFANAIYNPFKSLILKHSTEYTGSFGADPDPAKSMEDFYNRLKYQYFYTANDYLIKRLSDYVTSPGAGMFSLEKVANAVFVKDNAGESAENVGDLLDFDGLVKEAQAEFYESSCYDDLDPYVVVTNSVIYATLLITIQSHLTAFLLQNVFVLSAFKLEEVFKMDSVLQFAFEQMLEHMDDVISAVNRKTGTLIPGMHKLGDIHYNYKTLFEREVNNYMRRKIARSGAPSPPGLDIEVLTAMKSTPAKMYEASVANDEDAFFRLSLKYLIAKRMKDSATVVSNIISPCATMSFDEIFVKHVIGSSKPFMGTLHDDGMIANVDSPEVFWGGFSGGANRRGMLSLDESNILAYGGFKIEKVFRWNNPEYVETLSVNPTNEHVRIFRSKPQIGTREATEGFTIKEGGSWANYYVDSYFKVNNSNADLTSAGVDNRFASLDTLQQVLSSAEFDAIEADGDKYLYLPALKMYYRIVYYPPHDSSATGEGHTSSWSKVYQNAFPNGSDTDSRRKITDSRNDILRLREAFLLLNPADMTVADIDVDMSAYLGDPGTTIGYTTSIPVAEIESGMAFPSIGEVGGVKSLLNNITDELTDSDVATILASPQFDVLFGKALDRQIVFQTLLLNNFFLTKKFFPKVQDLFSFNFDSLADMLYRATEDNFTSPPTDAGPIGLRAIQESLGNEGQNPGPDIAAYILKMLLLTPLKILKGLAELLDPHVAIWRIVKLATAQVVQQIASTVEDALNKVPVVGALDIQMDKLFEFAFCELNSKFSAANEAMKDLLPDLPEDDPDTALDERATAQSARDALPNLFPEMTMQGFDLTGTIPGIIGILPGPLGIFYLIFSLVEALIEGGTDQMAADLAALNDSGEADDAAQLCAPEEEG